MTHSEFVIVGAGPVGLYLASRLAMAGREVAVLERDPERGPGSRAIGVHPPALEALSEIGAAEALIAAGVRITGARVFLGPHLAGELTLGACPPPYRFVLSIPQGVSEAVLERRLADVAPGALHRGAELVDARAVTNGLELRLADGRQWQARLAVGCDGRRSALRAALGVTFRGQAHDHHYLMADLPDIGGLGAEAAIYLCPEGVVESFPLPGGCRRWVARTRARTSAADVRQLSAIVRQRLGIELRGGGAAASAFTAETRLADALSGEGWALAGDAAHVVSPIGGQGMNLGLLGARSLADELLGGGDGTLLTRYSRLQQRRAVRAARRARLNMLLGSPYFWSPARAFALRVLLAPPSQRRASRYFTMRGL